MPCVFHLNLVIIVRFYRVLNIAAIERYLGNALCVPHWIKGIMVPTLSRYI